MNEVFSILTRHNTRMQNGAKYILLKNKTMKLVCKYKKLEDIGHAVKLKWALIVGD